MMEFRTTLQLWTNVKQLVPTTTRALLLIGSRAVLENLVGFQRQPTPGKLSLLLTMNWNEFAWEVSHTFSAHGFQSNIRLLKRWQNAPRTKGKNKHASIGCITYSIPYLKDIFIILLLYPNELEWHFKNNVGWYRCVHCLYSPHVVSIGFCCATLFIARPMPWRGVRLSVRLDVWTFVYCVEKAKRILKLFPPCVSPHHWRFGLVVTRWLRST